MHTFVLISVQLKLCLHDHSLEKQEDIRKSQLLIFYVQKNIDNSDVLCRDMMMSVGTLKRLPPSPPKRQSECVTVVADLHCPSPPAPAPSMPPTTNWSGLHTNGSDASFKVDIVIFIV